MRFGHQFEITSMPISEEEKERQIKYLKERGAEDIGRMINECFGFKKSEQTHELIDRWNMDITAFPTEEWVKFKKELCAWMETASKVGLLTFNLIMLKKHLEPLEELGREKSKEINEKRRNR